jgi:hypothetical protein
MWIWPSVRVVLDSACSPTVLQERIAARTDPQYVLGSEANPTDKAYEGWVEDGAFRVRPAWRGRRHAFRVFIEGQVAPSGAGSRLRATLHLDWGAVAIFWVFALAIAGAALLRPMVVGLEGPSRVFWLLYFVSGGLAYLLLMTAFWAGVGGARKFLSEVAAGPIAGGAPDGSVRPAQ